MLGNVQEVALCVHSVATDILPTMSELHPGGCLKAAWLVLQFVSALLTLLRLKDDFSGGSARRASSGTGAASIL